MKRTQKLLCSKNSMGPAYVARKLYRISIARTAIKNILKFDLHGVYLGEIAHDLHVFVEYPATQESGLEPIIGHTMSVRATWRADRQAQRPEPADHDRAR